MTLTAAPPAPPPPTHADPPIPASRRDLIGLLTAGDRPPIDTAATERLDIAFRAALTDIFGTDRRRGRLYAGTHQLELVTLCEGRALVELTEPFHWTLPTVRRGLVIESIRTWVAAGRRTPAAVAATDTLAWATQGGTQQSPGDLNRGVFLQHLDPHTRSALIADIASALTTYDSLVDPETDRWSIRFTQRLGVRTTNVNLRATADLVCGRSRHGDTHARKLLVNFTLGDITPSQRTALCRAALYDTIASGTAPRRCAAVSLDAGGDTPVEVIDITPDLLWQTAADTIDHVARYAWLQRHQDTSHRQLTPGDHCEHCPARPTCIPARTHTTDQALSAATG